MAGNKYISNASGVLTEVAATQSSGGSGDANKIVALDSNGLIAANMMPTGIGADTVSITTSEALSAGNLVNIWNNTGTASVRKADASVAGKEAHGYVLAAFASGVAATVYFEGNNNQVSGLTAGKHYLSTTPGTSSTTAPSGTTGYVVQVVGFATSATNLNFQSGTPISLA